MLDRRPTEVQPQLDMNEAPPVLNHALDYVRRGWPVLPLWGVRLAGEIGSIVGACRCERQCSAPGKHPIGRLVPNGLHDATVDPDQVQGWLADDPNANIAVATGVKFDALDFDSTAAFSALLGRFGPVGGPVSRTGRGAHVLLEVSGSGNRTKLAGIDGLDYRGSGGYIVAPPSLHAGTGQYYEWYRRRGPNTPLGSPPREALTASAAPQAASPNGRTVLSQSQVSRFVSGMLPRMRNEEAGNRNSLLHWTASRIAEMAPPDDPTIGQWLVELEEAAVDSGLPRGEAERTIRSAFSRR